MTRKAFSYFDPYPIIPRALSRSSRVRFDVAEKMKVQYLNASEDDFGVLVELRIEAMRESLGKIGRFDCERSVERFRSSFVAADTTRIFCDDMLAGFYSVTSTTDHLYLSHLYVKPEQQCLGIGSLAMEEIIELSNEVGLPIRLGALKESRSNDFYRGHGCSMTTEDEWDTHYERTVNGEQVKPPNLRS